jgi:hypothetical protein
MASTANPQTSSHTMVPLHLSGNMTASQDKRLQDMLSGAVKTAYQTIVEQLDQQSTQTVLDAERKLSKEVTDLLIAAVERHTASDKFKDEEVGSTRVYPTNYRVKPIEAQVTDLRKIFPDLKVCHEKLARRQLMEGCESWFAIPRWEILAPTYNEAVELVIETLSSKRRLSNRVIGKLTEKYLRQSERTKLAFKILAEQQEGSDILVVGTQFGLLHRGSSARRTRVALAGNEFSLGSFAIGCMLLTHPERLSTSETLMIDCGGDEYSVRGDYTFDRVPLFDYDIGGIEYSIFYEDRARNLWGTPTSFLYKLV